MGMNIILSLIMGITMTAIIGSQVAPNIIEKIKATKVESNSINNQEVIFEGVKRYITLKQSNPTSVGQIIAEGFLSNNVNDNGFGGTFDILVDDSNGTLNITTEINDTNAQKIFLNSFKNKFKPTCAEGINAQGDCIDGKLKTTFVIPMDVMHGSGLFMTGIPTQPTAPDKTKYKYWYDTSGSGPAILKISDGLDWKEIKNETLVASGTTEPTAIVDTTRIASSYEDLSLDESGKTGDIKYAYDSDTNSLQEYVYLENKGWVAKGWVNEGNSCLPDMSGTCPSGFVEVPNSQCVGAYLEHDVNDGVVKQNRPAKGWCVMKYEGTLHSGITLTVANGVGMWNRANNANSNIKVSSAAGKQPIGNLSVADAISICSSTHLVDNEGKTLTGGLPITYNIYKTLVSDLVMQDNNWTGEIFDSGVLYRGHSDSSGGGILKTGPDTNGYANTGNNALQANNAGKEQRRTHYTSEGEVIWDLAGNLRDLLYEGTNKAHSEIGWTNYYPTYPMNPFSPAYILMDENYTWLKDRGIGAGVYFHTTVATVNSLSIKEYPYGDGSYLRRAVAFGGLYSETQNAGLFSSIWYGVGEYLTHPNKWNGVRCIIRQK